MKIWIKYLLGAVVGAVLGITMKDFFSDPVVFDTGHRIILCIGKYTFFPMILFSVAFSVSKLMTEKRLLGIFIKTVSFTVASSLILTLLGGTAALLVFQGRIPLIAETDTRYVLPSLASHIAMIFPDNFFEIFTSSGNYLLPVLVLAVLMGLSMNYANLYTRPISQIFDSMSRIMYDINSLIIEFMPLGIVFLSASMTAYVMNNSQMGLYSYLFITVAAASAVVIFILIPLGLLICCRRTENPFKAVYAMLAPAMAAFFSGDIYFAANTLVKSSFENIGAKRKASAPIIGFLTVFSRSGTAMVSGAAIIIIIRSYTGIEITYESFFFLMLNTFLISFILGAVPGVGTAVSVTMLCSAYGHGIENGWLAIQPVMFLLISFSVMIDIIVMGFINAVITHQASLRKEINIRKFT